MKARFFRKILFQFPNYFYFNNFDTQKCAMQLYTDRIKQIFLQYSFVKVDRKGSVICSLGKYIALHCHQSVSESRSEHVAAATDIT